jgi:hypothetical protein
MGATITGNVTVKATAFDDDGVATFRFLVDGQLIGAPLVQPPYEVQWRSKDVFNGTHTISARAEDAGGLAREASVSVVTSNTNAPPSVTGGRTWNGAGFGCRQAVAVKNDPDGDPLTCHWAVGDGGAGQCRPNCGGCGPNDNTCAGSNDPAVPQESCEISITCTDSWGASDSETWTINRF